MTKPTHRRLKTLEDTDFLIKRQSADVVKTSDTALADLTGLSYAVLPGTYNYRIVLQITANASGGTKAAIKQNSGATLTSIQNVAVATTASAVAATRTTTATDAASLVAATAAHVSVVLEGTIVVATAGTLQVQGAQNASNASATTFHTGSTFTLTKIS